MPEDRIREWMLTVGVAILKTLHMSNKLTAVFNRQERFVRADVRVFPGPCACKYCGIHDENNQFSFDVRDYLARANPDPEKS